jgi:lambda repressor-like predicted transcriptional regulator
MLGINAPENARAKVHVTHERSACYTIGMRDWALGYILHVMQTKHWSANRLAVEAGVAASTIARPLRVPDWPHKISRTTISKIYAASGIDPASFIPEDFADDLALFAAQGRKSNAGWGISGLEEVTTSMMMRNPAPGEGKIYATIRVAPELSGPAHADIKVSIDGRLAHIDATVDRAGIVKLRAKLDAIEAMLDD